MNLSEKLAKSFPAGIELPSELKWLADWYEREKVVINRHFRVCVHEKDTLISWFGAETAKADSLAVFGRSIDGSMFAVWNAGGGKFPIVHLGSEGDELKVLANSGSEFLSLLAMGYDPLGHADTTKPPGDTVRTQEFRDWVENALHLKVPKTGDEIVSPAKKENPDFAAWIDG